MPAVARRLLAATALLAAPTAAMAVGLGPLTVSGLIDGPNEGFRLTLVNLDASAGDFTLYGTAWDGEARQPRIAILPPEATLGAGRTRDVLVIAQDLSVGETYRFRVCAERKPDSEGTMIHARVCSKITARRIG